MVQKSNNINHSSRKSKENIYDELINDLNPDESGYLKQLIHKQ